MAVQLTRHILTLIPRPVRSAAGADISGGMCFPLVVGTGSGPEGSRPTVNAWRPQGCGAEKGYVREAGCALSTENVSHLDFARVCLWQK